MYKNYRNNLKSLKFIKINGFFFAIDSTNTSKNRRWKTENKYMLPINTNKNMYKLQEWVNKLIIKDKFYKY